MQMRLKLQKTKLLKKKEKIYITNYTYVCIVLAISYTKTKPRMINWHSLNPKYIYLIHIDSKRMQVSEKFSSGSDYIYVRLINIAFVE